ncbi:aminoglycoside adenylyltransferase family protein [Bordetella trematum]|uniref:aminoglycoside adenylyltransferase family protein n=1 Tax=Bordetella trematum TaxID=123899 RepID=UPI000F63A9B8|nr:aminoglycoside adenylyltransferase family protein [Bordetella trematum]VDH08056.1 Streptomycin 3''-adenylyltransferase [Bordetella trematum]
MTPIIPCAIAPQVAQARAVLQRHLGESLVALYLYGSAVDGGLHPYSDIDLLAITDSVPSAAVRQALMTALLSVSAPPGASAMLRALEVTVLAQEHIVPWRHPARREAQFGEWLREALQAGIVEAPMSDPDLAILLTQARSRSLTILGRDAAALLAPVPPADLTTALQQTVAQWRDAADWAGDERNIILALARIWYTATQGGIASKASAADWLLARIDAPYRAVLAQARAEYLGLAPEELASQQDAVAAFIVHARERIQALGATST